MGRPHTLYKNTPAFTITSINGRSYDIPDNLPILIPLDSLFVGWEHGVGLLSLLEEAALAAPLTLHHQVMVLGLCHRWLL